MREEEKYQGVRLTLRARLGSAVIPVQVDIGFGDQVFPAPIRRVFPGLLAGLPAADSLFSHSQAATSQYATTKTYTVSYTVGLRKKSNSL